MVRASGAYELIDISGFGGCGVVTVYLPHFHWASGRYSR